MRCGRCIARCKGVVEVVVVVEVAEVVVAVWWLLERV